MGKALDKCPMCGEKTQWKLVDTTKKVSVLVKHLTNGRINKEKRYIATGIINCSSLRVDIEILSA